MNLRKLGLYLVCLTIGVLSCDKDDADSPVIDIRDRAEQQLADKDSLVKYLTTHYYNSSVIEAALPNAGINDIIITKIETGATVPNGHRLLLDAVGAPKTVVYEETDYEYYVLNLNQGGGDDAPTFTDNVQILYEGRTINNVVFDSRLYPNNSPIDLSGTIVGWQNVVPNFNTSESFTENNDGTVSYNNSGLGIMFLPSGLGYFSSAQGSIPAYAPLIFKFELLQMAENDHDGDGIPSYIEGLTDNTDADTYTDSNGFTRSLFNFLDTDDDGDGILTKDEITVGTINKPTLAEVKATSLEYNQVLLNKITKEQDGTYTGTIITFKDTDGVLPFDYLDKNY